MHPASTAMAPLCNSSYILSFWVVTRPSLDVPGNTFINFFNLSFVFFTHLYHHTYTLKMVSFHNHWRRILKLYSYVFSTKRHVGGMSVPQYMTISSHENLSEMYFLLVYSCTLAWNFVRSSRRRCRGADKALSTKDTTSTPIHFTCSRQIFRDLEKSCISTNISDVPLFRLFPMTPPPTSPRFIRFPHRIFQWGVHLWIGSSLPLDGEMVSNI